MNNIILTLKRDMFKYYRGNKKCSKCQDSTRLFFKGRCPEAGCNGIYRKEVNEFETCNEINFIRKIVDCKIGENDNSVVKLLNIFAGNTQDLQVK